MHFLKSFLCFAILTCVMGAPDPARADSMQQEASKFVKSVGDEAFAIIRDKSLGKADKQKKLERVFAKSVDIPWVGKFVLGRYWKQASEQQRTQYIKEYQGFIISHYTSRFAQYSGGDFKIISSKPAGSGQYVVSMEITPPSEDQPVLVDYRVHPTAGGNMQIFDVIVEGVSMITTQRSEFSAVLAKKGIDSLISQLANKTESIGKSGS